LVDERGVNDVATLLLHVFYRVPEFVEVVVPVGGMCVEDGVLLATHFVQLCLEVSAYFDEVLFDFLALSAAETRLALDHKLRDAFANFLQVIAPAYKILHLCKHVIPLCVELLPIQFVFRRVRIV